MREKLIEIFTKIIENKNKCCGEIESICLKFNSYCDSDCGNCPFENYNSLERLILELDR